MCVNALGETAEEAETDDALTGEMALEVAEGQGGVSKRGQRRGGLVLWMGER